MNLGEKIRTGVKWLLIGSTGNRVLEFAFGVVLARLLVPADFGMIITIQVFTGFVGMVTSGGMGQALIRAKEVDECDFHAVFTMQLALGFLVYLGFFLTAPWFAQYFDNPLYSDLMRVSALFFLIRPFAFMRISWLNREMDFKTRSIVTVVTSAITGIVSVLMAIGGMGVWSLTLSGLVGGVCRNILLARFTPLRLRLNFDVSIMRRHSSYGFKIIVNDLLSHIKTEATKLIMSKLGGPAFLGLFNKADSLNRVPFGMVGSPVNQTVFRAMSKMQDDLDQTKYMFYRVITLLMVYVLPFYVGLWWVAEPFIGIVYGEKWLAAAEPLRILSMVSFCFIIGNPCGVVLMAQNRLTQEMVAQTANLVVGVTACIIGINWGLVGVAWGVFASQVFGVIYFYILVYKTIPTRITDLLKAVTPGVLLNVLLFGVLAITDSLFHGLKPTDPSLYLLVMVFSGSFVYLMLFLFVPVAALESEVTRWRSKIGDGLRLLHLRR